MKRTRRLPELLAPAGSFDALVAAIAAGADAVYIGGTRFGARAYAKNFDIDELAEAVRLCHMFGTRLYVTLNTLIYDREMGEALSYAKQLYEMGVDALIIADLGLAVLIKKELPDFELHASTQMGVHNRAGADFAWKLGCNRVVLARECSEENIKSITEQSLAECEIFVHGALCVCHSGQCLFSSMVGGRSGNRGECAQPCRLPYNGGKHILSLCDLSLSAHINSLIDSGVSSLKIEGRMKSPAYVYEVTRIYRRLLDEKRCADREENQRLSDVFSRSGFTDGYYKSRLFSKMTGMRTEAEKEKSRELDDISISLPRIKISASASFALGKESSLTLSLNSASRWEEKHGENAPVISVTVKGAVPTRAENSPLTDGGVRERLAKMGNTRFSLMPGDIDLTLDEEINLSPSAINALRREAACALESSFSMTLDKILGKSSPAVPCTLFEHGARKSSKGYMKTALFFNTDALSAVVKKEKSLLSDIDIIFVPLWKYKDAPSGLARGVYLPPVIMEHQWNGVLSSLCEAREAGAEYALVGNISHIELAHKSGLCPIGDIRLNISNSGTYELFMKLGVAHAVLSPELTLPMARDIGGAVMTLGRVPLMITERCFIKESFGCDACADGRAALCDRRGERFPMLRDFEHRTVIFNSRPTYMGDKRAELRLQKLCGEHFIFSSEGAAECISLLEAYSRGITYAGPHRRVGKR